MRPACSWRRWSLQGLAPPSCAFSFRRIDRPTVPLRPGLTCDAEIVAMERRNVIAVPLQAVVERDEQSGVFTVADAVVRFTPVKAGIIGGLSIEVEGLAEGATIVSGPIQALRDLADGDAVRVERAGR